jgi:hypothetical protein
MGEKKWGKRGIGEWEKGKRRPGGEVKLDFHRRKYYYHG